MLAALLAIRLILGSVIIVATWWRIPRVISSDQSEFGLDDRDMNCWSSYRFDAHRRVFQRLVAQVAGNLSRAGSGVCSVRFRHGLRLVW